MQYRQNIYKTILKNLFKKMFSLLHCDLVTFHVSEPYKRTEGTTEI